MDCSYMTYCPTELAGSVGRMLDLGAAVIGLTACVLPFRFWGGAGRNAGALLALGCYLVMLSVVAILISLFLPPIPWNADRMTPDALEALALVAGFMGLMLIGGVLVKQPTGWMRFIGGTMTVLIGLFGGLGVVFAGYNFVRWTLPEHPPWIEPSPLYGLVLLSLIALVGLAALTIPASFIALACERRTRTLLLRAVVLSLVGTGIEAGLLTLAGPRAWLVGSRLAGLDLILASMVIGAGAYVMAHTLDAERPGRGYGQIESQEDVAKRVHGSAVHG